VGLHNFAGAARYHTGGLVDGEVPIIAQPGEAVFTPGQMRALGGALSSKNQPQVRVAVNVINNASGVDARVQSSLKLACPDRLVRARGLHQPLSVAMG
jgi:hypothetical protein